MLSSMTAFTTLSANAHSYSWTWDLRGVNAKGLDVRLRLPDWIEGLEQVVRGQISQSVARGNVTLGLRIVRDDQDGALTVNTDQLDRVLATLQSLEARAAQMGVPVAPVTSLELMNTRGVMDVMQITQETEPLKETLISDLGALLEDFVAMRQAEGKALEAVLTGQIDKIEQLTKDTAEVADARRPQVAKTLRTNLARVMENSDGVDKDRLAQELAMLAVKADVTEEIDRLAAHVKAARDLLAQGSPIGRKLDFLMQEFNREANTLCSKSQDTALTAIGLDLKATIDQMREQVQNVE